MKVLVAAVGKPRDAALAAAIRDFEGRAAHYWPLEVVEVKEEPARGGITPAQVMEREGERLAAKVPRGALVVLCDPGGDTMDSRAFADWLQQQRERARRGVRPRRGFRDRGDAAAGNASPPRVGAVDVAARAGAVGTGRAVVSRGDAPARRTLSQVARDRSSAHSMFS